MLFSSKIYFPSEPSYPRSQISKARHYGGLFYFLLKSLFLSLYKKYRVPNYKARGIFL